MANAVCNGRVDAELGDVALHACVVIAFSIAWQFTALYFHFVRRLPAAQNHFTHTAHGLAVGAEHADGAQVMQDVFGGNGFFADAAFCKCQVFCNGRVEVMADHQHVDVFVQCVDGVWACGVGGGGQHVGLTYHFQDVGRMTTTGTFSVEGVNGSAFEGGDGVFHKARFVQGVGVDGHLNIGFFGHVQAVVDGGWGGAPIFVQLEANGACVHLFTQGIGQCSVAFAQETQVHGECISRLHHALNVVRAGCASSREGTCGGASTTA